MCAFSSLISRLSLHIFHNSSKCTAVLDKIVGKRIPTASDVRWSSNARILKTVSSQRENIITVCNDIEEDPLSSPESMNGAIGLKKQSSKHEICFFIDCVRGYIFNDRSAL